MNLSIMRAAVTAAAVAALACATAFASGMAVDLAVTGLFHFPAVVTMVLGALVVGADCWFGVWLFRQAYKVERQLDADGGYPHS